MEGALPEGFCDLPADRSGDDRSDRCGSIRPARPGPTAMGRPSAGAAGKPRRGAPRGGPGGLRALTHPRPGAYFWRGLVMAAGYSLAWLAGVLGTGRRDGARQPESAADVALLAEQAKGSPPGSRGLAFPPFLGGAATP